MQKRDRQLLYSPRDLIQFVQSEFAIWMERYALEYPEMALPKPAPDEMMRILQQLGEDHERSYVESLRRVGAEIYEIDSRGGFQATLAAMAAGKPLIYQGAIAHQNWLGYADFLVRVEGRSRWGSWHYLPLECKLALHPKPYFVLQSCAYCDLLERIQEVRPAEFELVLGTGERQCFRTDDYFHYYRQVKQAFLAMMSKFDHQQPPVPQLGDHGIWAEAARERLLALDHLSQVAQITQTQIKRLEAAGIRTVQDLAVADSIQKIPKLARPTYEKLVRQARLQRNRAGDRPPYEILYPPADQPRSGLALLPPPSPGDVFFDLEGYPLAEGGAGLEYLWGVTFMDEQGQRQFRDWWAHHAAAERQAFEGFIDWIWMRRQQNPMMHVYHYAPYEITALKRLMGRYGTREEELDALLRAEVFVDLYRVVRQGLCVGEPSYSIKNLEHLYWHARGGEVKNAQASVVQYFQWQWRWQRGEAGETPEDSNILREIRDYNRDDCDSTQALADWLRSLQSQSGIRYCPNRETETQATLENSNLENSKTPTPAAQLALELLHSSEAEIEPKIPLEKSQTQLSQSTQALLAHLLQFHRREAKPFWWQRFTWLTQDEDELYEELDCLAGLERTATPPFRPTPRSRSWAYEYQFNPDQETRLRDKTACWFTPNTELLKDCTLAELDTVRGRAILTLSDTKLKTVREQSPNWEPPARLSVLDVTVIPTNYIAEAILETVQQWQATGQLQPALADFLERRSPRIHHHRGGPILVDGEDLLTGSLRAIAQLDRSTLCIQGPPGSGKTFTAAHIILNLIQQGKSVAISANSHDVILNLLVRVQRYFQTETKSSCKIAKVGGERQTGDRYTGIEFKAKISEALPPNYGLVGATVFQLCRTDAIAQFDYLFVDEAGQVALANLIAMARCADNLVLIGDPMQLEQPIQGSHPGESGGSALGYWLRDKATIPPDLGIFLGLSYRMEPQICRFISGSVYENRLDHHPETQHHGLHFSQLQGHNWRLNRSRGLAFLPVPHEDNTQVSLEEVEVIAALVQQLLGIPYVSDRGQLQGRLTPQDILIVAPYNLQVRKLQDRLGESARIGTVDKFQGQEAPVVIVSMTASRTEDAPRGIEFLLNRNRLNVAVSRAQCLAIVVASPAIATAHCTTLDQMVQLNLFCKLMQQGMA